MVEAEDLDRHRGAGVLQTRPGVVVHRAHLAPGVSGDDRRARMHRAALDQNRCDGPAADVEARLDDEPRGVRLRVRAQLEHVRLQQEHLEKARQAGLLAGGDVDEDRLPAPLLGLQPVRRQLLADALGVRVRSIDLVDGDDDRDLGGLRVVDRLDRLRHHAVVGRDDEHDDVGGVGAAGAHGGEGLMARRVEEGDAPAVDGRLVGADVLRDAAGLGRDDGRLADRVEQATSCRGRRGP